MFILGKFAFSSACFCPDGNLFSSTKVQAHLPPAIRDLCTRVSTKHEEGQPLCPTGQISVPCILCSKGSYTDEQTSKRLQSSHMYGPCYPSSNKLSFDWLSLRATEAFCVSDGKHEDSTCKRILLDRFDKEIYFIIPPHSQPNSIASKFTATFLFILCISRLTCVHSLSISTYLHDTHYDNINTAGLTTSCLRSD